MSSKDDAREALLEAITTQVRATESATALLKLAEAFAWTVYPNQPHGGSVKADN